MEKNSISEFKLGWSSFTVPSTRKIEKAIAKLTLSVYFILMCLRYVRCVKNEMNKVYGVKNQKTLVPLLKNHVTKVKDLKWHQKCLR